MIKERTIGGELEKPVSTIATGEPHGVSQNYFSSLADQARQRGQEPHFHNSDIKPEVALGVSTKDLGEQGLDNATNLVETALPVTDSLESLSEKIDNDIETVQTALAQEGATIINMSIHPLGCTDEASYKAYVAPKGIYAYLWHRGWDHSAGIDAKAQNSPATGVDAEEAADAVSSMIGFGAATIALYANSPIAEGRITGAQESRLLMWERMMAGATVEGDRTTARYPENRFHTMKDYFEWMFGGETGIHFVVATSNGVDYKTAGKLVTVDGNPSVLSYLAKDHWEATVFGTTQKIEVASELGHMSSMQFAQFSGARIRYAFNEGADKGEFLEAMSKNRVEEFFQANASYIYIEGRDPGANFPDRELLNRGGNIARSVAVSASAIQLGVINNLGEATQVLDKYGWQTLGLLRQEAIMHGMEGSVNGVRVVDLALNVLTVAENGLPEGNRWMLEYPKHVLETRQNGASRALEQLRNDSSQEAIRELVKSRQVIIK